MVGRGGTYVNSGAGRRVVSRKGVWRGATAWFVGT
jgi:hypothetical protein